MKPSLTLLPSKREIFSETPLLYGTTLFPHLLDVGTALSIAMCVVGSCTARSIFVESPTSAPLAVRDPLNAKSSRPILSITFFFYV